MSSSFTLALPEPSDAMRLTVIDEVACLHNPMRMSLSTYSRVSKETQQEHLEWASSNLEKYLSADQHSLWFKAVDQAGGEVAGWIELKKPGFDGPKGSDSTKSESQQSQDQSASPKQSPCLLMDKVNEFVHMWEAARSRNMGDRNDYWCIAKLDVHPEFQRRGAGQLLLSKMLELASPSGLDVYVAATPAARRLLEKNGFKVLDTAKCDGIENHLLVMLKTGGSTEETATH